MPFATAWASRRTIRSEATLPPPSSSAVARVEWDPAKLFSLALEALDG